MARKATSRKKPARKTTPRSSEAPRLTPFPTVGIGASAELLAHTWEPVIMFDFAAGTVLYWNRAAEDTYGYAASEAMGRGIQQLLESGQDIRQMRRELERDGRWSGELLRRRKDGADIEVEARVALVRQSGGAAVAVEATRPITERKALENTLREQAAQLQAADRNRNNFLALLAHELRTPLGALRNISQLLRTPGASPDAVDRARGMMNRQIQNMARMIDDLLDVARVAQGQIELRREPLDLRTVIERALDVTRAKIDERGQKLSVALGEKPLDIEGDASRLEQIFVNLLTNASKFTQPGGRIWLGAEVTRSPARGAPAAPPQVSVRLRDEGVGIGKSFLPHVFDLFAQAERSPERLEGGLGLGLTVVRRVVELHGGSVAASSAGLGMGSEFTVRLPLSPVLVGEEREVPAPAESRRRPRSTGPKRVLIVDDEPDGAETMALVLRQEGHEAQVAHSAESALEALSEFKPSVAIIDIALPGMDGFALAEAIASRPEMRKTRLVGVSGFSQTVLDPDGDKSKVFDRVLEKPVDLDILRDILQGG